MGASVADYDNDGRDDVYVTALGGNLPLPQPRRPLRGGDRRRPASRDSGWGTSSAWLDYDGDGLLDLYVGRYVDWSPTKDLFCTLDGKTKSYCTPERYPGTSVAPLPQRSAAAASWTSREAPGTGNANQKALGVAPWDFDGDGRVDLLVANDTAPNNLFRNKGDGTFEDVAIPTGVAVDEAGRARGAMGAAWADTKNGRGVAVAIGNFSNELEVALLDRLRARSSSTSRRGAASARPRFST